jgi:Mn2+/Fe2+ NRAMP family transporter
VPFAALAVGVLVLRGSFGRVEHVLLALSAIFVAYIFSGFLAGPDWGATARGLVVPNLPSTRHGLLVVVATLDSLLTAAVIVLVAVSVVALGVLSLA